MYEIRIFGPIFAYQGPYKSQEQYNGNSSTFQGEAQLFFFYQYEHLSPNIMQICSDRQNVVVVGP